MNDRSGNGPSGYYSGAVARTYEQQRSVKGKWRKEEEALRDLVGAAGLPSEPSIVDVPVGTGRFLPYYDEVSAEVIGLDLSTDMLSEASQRAAALGLTNVNLRQADALDLPLEANSADLAVCIRFLNWMPLTAVEQILRELSRVSRDAVIVGARSRLPFGDIGFLAAVRRTRWVTRRIARTLRGGQPAGVRHAESDILSVIERSGLTVERRVLIEHGKDGTRYDLYLLRNSISSGGKVDPL